MCLYVLLTVYRTYPLNDPRLLSKKSQPRLHHALPPPDSVASSRLRTSDTDLALQNLAKLNVSHNGQLGELGGEDCSLRVLLYCEFNGRTQCSCYGNLGIKGVLCCFFPPVRLKKYECIVIIISS